MNSRHQSIISILLLLLLWGCSPLKTKKISERIRKLKNLTVIPFDVKPANQISFKKNGVYGSTSKVLIGQIFGIAVDDSGRVFISDLQKMAIDVFGPNGRFLTHLGRKGRGPGEFESIGGLIIIRHNLYVYDPTILRMNIFSLDSLKLVNTINTNPTNRNKIPGLTKYTLWFIYPLNNGNYIVIFRPPFYPGTNGDKSYMKFYLMNNRMKIIPHQILKLKTGNILTGNVGGQLQSAGFSFLSNSLYTVSPNGTIYTAWTSNFLVKKYDSIGNYKHTIYYPYKSVSLTRDEAMKYSIGKGRYRGAKIQLSILNQNTLPKTWPALNSFITDDQNRLWISTIVKNMQVYQWWILTQKGKLLARFNWPRDKPIELIKSGYMYILEKNKKGLEEIVRYKIIMKPQKNNDSPFNR